ncbi:Crossover junction endonuclease mus81, partial [Mortierella sp. AD010]
RLLTMQCGNPLYLEWIGEWMETARENNNQAYFIYRKAYESMAKYPTRFSHPSEAMCLSGIGEKIAAKLEKKLIEYCKDNDLPMPTPKSHAPRAKAKVNVPADQGEDEPKPKKARQRAYKPYIPTYRSGAYAILLALLDAPTVSVDGSLTKYEITTMGQIYCDVSLTNPEHGKFYTGWSSMKTLLDKSLVYRSSSKFYLTEEGIDMARRLRAVASETESNLLPSPDTGEQNSLPHASTSQWESRVMDWSRDAPTNIHGAREQASYRAPGPTTRLDSVSTASTNTPQDTPVNTNDDYTYDDDDDFDGWNDTPSSRESLSSSSVAPTTPKNINPTAKAVTSSFRTLEGNRDQPVNIISDSEDEKDDMLMETSSSSSLSRVSSSSKMEGLEAQNNEYLMANPTFTSSGLRRVPSLFKLPTRPATITQTFSRPEPTTYRHSTSDGFLSSKSTDSLLSNDPRSHHDSFPHLKSNSTALARSDSSSGLTDIKRLAGFQPIKFIPGTFEICLVLDIREVRTQTDRDYLGQKLKDRGVNVTKRALDVGDVIWVARLKDPSFDGPDEIVLDYIVERKRMDDLVYSIKDGRFTEQKFRLKRSGLGHVIYLVETHRLGEVYEIGADAIRTATTAIQIHDNFFLRRTNHTDHTIDYLVNVTNALKRLYEYKTSLKIYLYKSETLFAIPDAIVNRSTYLDLQRELKESYPDRTYLTSYRSFSVLNGKSETIVVKDMFVKMLMTIRGVSSEKAMEIARIYKTPRGLFSALEKNSDLTGSAHGKGSLVKSGSNVHKKRKISQALSAKIAGIWYADEYQ